MGFFFSTSHGGLVQGVAPACVALIAEGCCHRDRYRPTVYRAVRLPYHYQVFAWYRYGM